MDGYTTCVSTDFFGLHIITQYPTQIPSQITAQTNYIPNDDSNPVSIFQTFSIFGSMSDYHTSFGLNTPSNPAFRYVVSLNYECIVESIKHICTNCKV